MWDVLLRLGFAANVLGILLRFVHLVPAIQQTCWPRCENNLMNAEHLGWLVAHAVGLVLLWPKKASHPGCAKTNES